MEHAESNLSLGLYELMISITKSAINPPIGKCKIIGWNLPMKKIKVLSTVPSSGIKSRPTRSVVKIPGIKIRFFTSWIKL